jgi:hypothetical protein
MASMQHVQIASLFKNMRIENEMNGLTYKQAFQPTYTAGYPTGYTRTCAQAYTQAIFAAIFKASLT